MFDFICTIQYNGKSFSGWSKQKSAKTIQGTIEKAIQRVTKNANFKTIGASKTDAGVHALDQKMLLVLDFEPELKQFRQALNAVIKPDINIIAIEKTTADFHIRSCRQKEYQYTINLGAYDLLRNDFEWHITYPFVREKFEQALQLFIGEHDFLHFSGLNQSEAQEIRTVRHIDDIVVQNDGDRIVTLFTGKGFIRYQIRMIVGACAAYALGKIKNLSDITDVLNLKKEKFNHIADPAGLILKRIIY
jgi:tRNA pseudouridine38-40 synthase